MSDTKGTESNDPEGTEKQGGAGQDGTIPPEPDGLAAGLGGETSNFNEEEDPESGEDTSAGS